jgi:hypothetical protein
MAKIVMSANAAYRYSAAYLLPIKVRFRLNTRAKAAFDLEQKEPKRWLVPVASGLIYGLAVTTALSSPILPLSMKNMALFWRVSGLPATSKGRLST